MSADSKSNPLTDLATSMPTADLENLPGSEPIKRKLRPGRSSHPAPQQEEGEESQPAPDQTDDLEEDLEEDQDEELKEEQEERVHVKPSMNLGQFLGGLVGSIGPAFVAKAVDVRGKLIEQKRSQVETDGLMKDRIQATMNRRLNIAIENIKRDAASISDSVDARNARYGAFDKAYFSALKELKGDKSFKGSDRDARIKATEAGLAASPELARTDLISDSNANLAMIQSQVDAHLENLNRVNRMHAHLADSPPEVREKLSQALEESIGEDGIFKKVANTACVSEAEKNSITQRMEEMLEKVREALQKVLESILSFVRPAHP